MYRYICVLYRLPSWCSGKESTCQCGDTENTVSLPGSGRSPGAGNGNPLQNSCLENSVDRGAWQATVHGVTKELDTTEHTHTHCISHIWICVLYSLLPVRRPHQGPRHSCCQGSRPQPGRVWSWEGWGSAATVAADPSQEAAVACRPGLCPCCFQEIPE